MRLTRAHRLACLGLVLLGAVPAPADEAPDLGGFEDDDFGSEPPAEAGTPEAEAGETEAAASEERWWDLDGSVGISSSVNYLSHDSPSGTDYTGLSRLRTRLNLELDVELPLDWKLRVSPYIWYDFAYLANGRNEYTGDVLDEYEWEGDFQDSYVEGPLHEDVDLKIGRQVVNWGRSDTLRVLDVLNPIDNREPGRADIEDLRWSIGMAKLDWYVGPHWTLTAIGIPEIRFDTLPPWGSDFGPTAPLPHERVPNSFEHWEAAGSVRGIFEGWDVSFHYAYLYEDIPRLAPGERPPSAEDPFGFVLLHDRIQMGGVGGNYTSGAWLFKGEAAGFYGFRYPFVSAFTPEGFPAAFDVTDRKWRFDAMLGVEYYGFSETTIAVEAVNRYLIDFDRVVGGFPAFQRENSTEWSARYTADWFNARLQTTLLAVIFGYDFQDGAVLRLQGDYTILDGLVFTGGILLYQAGDLPPIDQWGRNDRLFFDIKYSF